MVTRIPQEEIPENTTFGWFQHQKGAPEQANFKARPPPSPYYTYEGQEPVPRPLYRRLKPILENRCEAELDFKDLINYSRIGVICSSAYPV